jgi:hypothetical protein
MDAMLKAVSTTISGLSRSRPCARGQQRLDPLRYKIATNELEAKFCLPFLMASLIVSRKAGVHASSPTAFVKSTPVRDHAARHQRLRSEDRGPGLRQNPQRGRDRS